MVVAYIRWIADYEIKFLTFDLGRFGHGEITGVQPQAGCLPKLFRRFGIARVDLVTNRSFNVTRRKGLQQS
jgi:hypothetical protein